MRGATAALLDRSKYWEHAGHLHPRNTFVSASVDTYGNLGSAIMPCLRILSDVASAHSLAVTWGAFLASAHRELSEAVEQRHGSAHRFCTLLFANASGWPVLPGAKTPCVDSAYCSPYGAFLFGCDLFFLSANDSAHYGFVASLLIGLLPFFLPFSL
jgi:hypothetical protein